MFGMIRYLPLSQCCSGFGSCVELLYIVRLARREEAETKPTEALNRDNGVDLHATEKGAAASAEPVRP
jgi:hypothetical protein